MGNPTEYKGNELKWTRMRQLVQYGDSNFFEYGADGIRCKKNETDYILSGSRILKENRGTVSLTYYYGLSGVIGFHYDAVGAADDADYFYQKNLQGDITGIYTAYGTLVAEYKYDAWGKVLAVVNHTSANIGDLNPFRYRGYYYDTETDLYYLQTRYYDPETGRFINADDLAYLGADESLSSYNLYAYCANNPVNAIDPSGHSAILIALAIGAVLGGIYGGISAAANDQNVLAGIAIGAVVGGLTGLVTEIASVPVILLATFAFGAGGDIASQMILDGKNFGEVNLITVGLAGVINASLALVGKGLSNLDAEANLQGAEK